MGRLGFADDARSLEDGTFFLREVVEGWWLGCRKRYARVTSTSFMQHRLANNDLWNTAPHITWSVKSTILTCQLTWVTLNKAGVAVFFEWAEYMYYTQFNVKIQ